MLSGVLSTITTILLFLLIIGVSIMIHEFGHYIVAKLTGMKVEEFSFGFGPKLFSRKKGDTEYMIKPFLIGGYVKILGEESKVKNKRSFSEKSIWARIGVVLAGVVMNFFLAVLLFYVVMFASNFKYSGVQYYEDFDFWFGKQTAIMAFPVTILDVESDSPADQAGLKAPFEILKIDGVEVKNNDELTAELTAAASKQIPIEIRNYDEGKKYFEDNSEVVQIQMDDTGKLGVSPMEDVKAWEVEYTGIEKPFAGFLHAFNMTQATGFLFGKIVKQAVAEKTIQPVAENLSGPVGLYAILDFVKTFGGFSETVHLVGAISLTLAIMNLLPLPALDGGFIILLIIEGIRGKPVNEKIKNWLFGGGMIFLFALMILITGKDIVQFGVWDWFVGIFEKIKGLF